MHIILLRAATAILIALSASTGMRSEPASGSATQASPSVLSAQIEKLPAPSNTPEPTASDVIEPKPNILPQAQQTPTPQEQLISEELRQKEKEAKVLRLQLFLQKYDSPMAENAQDFIDASEQYDLDWKLVPSIAGVESTFGKHLIPGTYNAYGWGGGTIKFDSWRDGIYDVSRGLSENYIKRGRLTPFQIQPVYAPPSTTWGSKVSYFMSKIDAQTLPSSEDK